MKRGAPVSGIFFSLGLLSACATHPSKETLFKEAVDNEMKAHHEAYQTCFDQSIGPRDRALALRIIVSFSIMPDGTVANEYVETGTLHSSAAENCILTILHETRFAVHEDHPVMIAYPFAFNEPKAP